jgi:hypothetical protein
MLPPIRTYKLDVWCGVVWCVLYTQIRTDDTIQYYCTVVPTILFYTLLAGTVLVDHIVSFGLFGTKVLCIAFKLYYYSTISYCYAMLFYATLNSLER